MDTPFAHEIYSVTQLNQAVRGLLEQAFPLIWVEGEISNLAQPASGHRYFTLKDAQAQVRCALFRNRGQYLRFAPKNGDRVRLRARIGLYAPRGDYQLIAEHLEPAGDGALQRAFEALKAQLEAEGLFAAERKKPLPTVPRRIGVITSPTGAAIRDVLSVLKRRFPALPVLIYPVAVQGEQAPEAIAQAIARADQRAEVDVLLLTRGGGSLEDLQAFNEAIVARAIAACELPIISAVGHEVDYAISDWVADERAATPSAAAERLSPDGVGIAKGFAAAKLRLEQAMQRRIADQRSHLQRLERRLGAQHPGRRLRERGQRLDELEYRLGLAIQARLARVKARLQENARALEAVSPLATLHRGYAIVRLDAPDGTIVRAPTQAPSGTRIRAQLAEGELHARVEAITPNESY